MLGKDRAIVILLFVARRVDREAFSSVRHLFITDGRSRDLLQSINPTVAYAIGELLFLAPCHFLGQHVGERVAHHFLLNGFARTHLVARINRHGYIQELLVEEGHTTLHAPGSQTLVGTQTVILIEFGKLAHRFLMELLR